MRTIKVSILLCSTVMLCASGCGYFEDPYVANGTIGGIAGAGIGAGTGALIADGMASDVGQGALVGGAIGLPIGILAGVGYQSYKEQSHIDKNDQAIRENYEYIVRRQQEIDRMRGAIEEDSFAIEPDQDLRSYIYTGPTIGAYGR